MVIHRGGTVIMEQPNSHMLFHAIICTFLCSPAPARSGIQLAIEVSHDSVDRH